MRQYQALTPVLCAPFHAGEPPLTATGTLSIEIWEVNDHAPVLTPLAGVVCSQPGRGRPLLLSATDEDLSPHAEPFNFSLGHGDPQLARNWTLGRVNSEGLELGLVQEVGGMHGHRVPHLSLPAETHAALRLLAEVPEGLYVLPVLVRDSGIPPQERKQALNVSVCLCGDGGACWDGTTAASAVGAGLSFEALMIVLGTIILLLRK